MKDTALPLYWIAALVLAVVFAAAYLVALRPSTPSQPVPPSTWADDYRARHAKP